MCILDFDLSLKRVNNSFSRILGYTKEELIGTKGTDYVHPEDIPLLIRELNNLIYNTTPMITYSNRFRCKDGSYKWIEWTNTPILEERLFYSVGRDVTKRKKLEENNTLYQKRLEALVKMNNMADATIKETGVFALEEMVNLTGSELGWLGFVNEDESQVTMFAWSNNAMLKCRIGNKPLTFSVNQGGLWAKAIHQRRIVITNNYAEEIDKKGLPEGHVPLKNILSVPIFDGKRIVMQAVVANKGQDYDQADANQLTLLINGYWSFIQQKKAEEERMKTQQELHRLDRLNLIGQMAAGIGHEVRNPMTTVRGFLQMLSKKEELCKYKGYYNLMIEELDRANSIITEFLSLVRNNPSDLQPQNLNKIIDDLYPLVQADALNSNNDIIIKQTPLPDINISKNEIHQLILNMIRNGLDAMKNTGYITIKTFMERGEIVLAIKDEGSGIDPGIIDKLGTPFLTTKAEGTGLGLATCYRIAERHNARIEVESSPKGTTFYIKFKNNQSL